MGTRAVTPSSSSFSASGKPVDPPLEAVTLMHYIEFSRHAGIDVPGLELYQTAVAMG